MSNIASVIDRISGDANIAELWASKLLNTNTKNYSSGDQSMRMFPFPHFLRYPSLLWMLVGP